MWRAAVLVTLLACSSHGLTPEGFGAAELDARCTHLVTCGLFTDHAACVAFFSEPDDPSPAAAIAAHHTRFDGAAATACLDAIANASCDASAKDTREPPAACAQVFVGLGDSGAACAKGDECASGNCVVPACGSACCTGTCGDPVTLPTAGQTCTGACAGDDVCNDNGLCVALAPPGGSCAESNECTFGYGCTGTVGNPSGTCTTLPGFGAGCPDGDCGDVGAVCDTQLVCSHAGLTGDPCTTPNDCSAFYQCDATGHCNPYPTRGMPCTSLCSDGSWCDRGGGTSGTSGTCAAPKPSGMPCVANVECTTRLCDTSGGPGTGTCAPVPVCI